MVSVVVTQSTPKSVLTGNGWTDESFAYPSLVTNGLLTIVSPDVDVEG